MTSRRIVCAIAFAALVIAAIDPALVTVAFTSPEALAAEFVRAADREWWPYYPRYIEAVRAATPPGSTIAIVVPPMRWDDGYSYAYYRASYLLAGRNVLPVVWRDDRVLIENVRAAQYVAVWRRPFPEEHLRVVFRGGGGVLLAR